MNKQFTIEELRSYSQDWLKENYGMDLKIPLNLNGRLTKTLGYFLHRINNRTGERTPVKLDISRHLVEKNNPDVVLDILKHELIHYVMFERGLPFRDGDKEFENELALHGVVSQSTINKIEVVSKPQNYKVYECTGGHRFERRRKLSHDGAYHRCHCGGRLKPKGEILK